MTEMQLQNQIEAQQWNEQKTERHKQWEEEKNHM